MAATSVDRKDLLALLDKMGAEYTSKITVARAKAKLKRHIEKKGLPGKLTKNETITLKGIGVDVPDKPAAKKKAPSKKKAASKKAASKKTTAKKDKPKKIDWMTAAALALKENGNIQKAEEHAVKLYLDAGGRNVDKIRANATLNVSRAKRVILALGIGEMSEDGKSISLSI